MTHLYKLIKNQLISLTIHLIKIVSVYKQSRPISLIRDRKRQQYPSIKPQITRYQLTRAAIKTGKKTDSGARSA